MAAGLVRREMIQEYRNLSLYGGLAVEHLDICQRMSDGIVFGMIGGMP
jgi:hypothetical protein